MRKKNLLQNIGIIIFVFFLFQFISFLGYLKPLVSDLVFWLVILAAVGFSLIKIEYGFLFLIFEFLAGHEGHLFEFAGLSLRLALFLAIMFVWLVKKISRERKGFFNIFIKPKTSLFFSIFLLIVFLAFVQGLLQNDPVLAIKDFINYSYFLLVFPLMEVFQKEWFQKNVFKFSQAATVGLSLLTVFVFVMFVSGAVQVHDQFYWWWRSVVVGKATDTATGFFRIVSSAHLLVLPLFLIYLSFLAEPKTKKKKPLICLAFLSGLVLLINFSRVYFLGFLVGLLFLLKHLPWRRWLIFSLITVFVLVFEFYIIYGLSTGEWKSQSLLFFKGRMETVVSPDQEMSSLTRMNILPKLLGQISQQPVFSRGLGMTVSYFDPLAQAEKSTFHLDWGYLEIWLELGFFGLVFYLLLLSNVFYQGWKKIRVLNQVWQKRLVIGLLAGLVALMVSTLTGPFLFHPLGIFYVVLTSALITNLKQNDEIQNCNPNSHLE